MPQHYIKIEIKGESDLPKEVGRYETCCKGDLRYVYWEGTPDDKDYWMLNVDYYFLPVPEPQQPEQTESAELKEAIDEREALIKAFDEIRKSFQGRSWIIEGRGAYPYDDERYKEEVRYILDEFEEINKNLWKQIKSKSFEYKERLKKEIMAEFSQSHNNTVVNLNRKELKKKVCELIGNELYREAEWDRETLSENIINCLLSDIKLNNTVVGPSEGEISVMLDKANFDTSKEREDAYDLIKYALSQCKAIDLKDELVKFRDQLKEESGTFITDEYIEYYIDNRQSE